MKTLKKRKKSSKEFKLFCKMGLYANLLFLGIFLSSLSYLGFDAMRQTYILADSKSPDEIKVLLSRDERRKLRSQNLQEPTWLLANSQVDQHFKQKFSTLNDSQRSLIDTLVQKEVIKFAFNINFFLNGDSKTSPEKAGVFAAMLGTLQVIFICMFLAVPLGIGAAIYLEEFAKANLLTQLIEICINNLAAIPSIIFGLLGLSVFINFFGVPRSSALVGGLTLALMSLPIIIVASKAALKSVDHNLKNAALALGLSKWQMIRGIVLPLATPMMITGSILALASAIGETAPLMLIGMIAFIPDSSASLSHPSTALPALIYNWASMPERAFLERAAAAIVVLLSLVFVLNFIAIFLRKYFQRKNYVS